MNKWTRYILIFLVNCSMSLAATFQPISCLTERLDLSNALAYESSALDDSMYPRKNGYDGNPFTFMHLNVGVNLDSGYEWYMLFVNSRRFQFIHTVFIIAREGIEIRSTNIEILVASSISKSMTMFVGSTNMPWAEFTYCGTTPSASTAYIIVPCKLIMNSRYVMLRRTYQFAFNCINFNEIQVDILRLPVRFPVTDCSKWDEGTNHTISTSCSAPNSNIKTIWFEQMSNGTIKRIVQEGPQITFNSVVRTSPKQYYYELQDRTTNFVIYTSNLTDVVQITYVADLLTLSNVYEVKEDSIVNINCTSNAGYPYPNVLLELDNVVANSSLGNFDIYGGRSASSYLSLVAQMMWNGKTVKCTRMQNGFPNITKSFVLSVQSKMEAIVFNSSSPTIVNKTLEINEKFSYDLSSYIISAFPDQLNISCSESGTVYFAMYLKSYKDLKITLLSNGSFVCTIAHKLSQKTILFSLILNNQIKFAAENLKIYPEDFVSVNEVGMIDINCTSSSGYPYPNLTLVMDNVFGNISWSNVDALGGVSAQARIFLPAQMKWNDKVVTCIQTQTGFQNITKTTVVRVASKNEGVVYNTSFPFLIKKTFSSMGESFSFNLSAYIISASPNVFNISCLKNKVTYFGLFNATFIDFFIQLPSAGNYICTISHKTSQKTIQIQLKNGVKLSEKAGLNVLLNIGLGGLAGTLFMVMIFKWLI